MISIHSLEVFLAGMVTGGIAITLVFTFAAMMVRAEKGDW